MYTSYTLREAKSLKNNSVIKLFCCVFVLDYKQQLKLLKTLIPIKPFWGNKTVWIQLHFASTAHSKPVTLSKQLILFYTGSKP